MKAACLTESSTAASLLERYTRRPSGLPTARSRPRTTRWVKRVETRCAVHVHATEGVGLGEELGGECLKQLVHTGRVHYDQGTAAGPGPQRAASDVAVDPREYFDEEDKEQRVGDLQERAEERPGPGLGLGQGRGVGAGGEDESAWWGVRERGGNDGRHGVPTQSEDRQPQPHR